jgi:hypothetical protein
MLTPSRIGEFPLDFLVMTEILCPMAASLDDRWYTVDPIPPHLGGYSPDIIAMCMAPPVNRSREALLKRTGVEMTLQWFNNSPMIGDSLWKTPCQST